MSGVGFKICLFFFLDLEIVKIQWNFDNDNKNTIQIFLLSYCKKGKSIQHISLDNIILSRQRNRFFEYLNRS